MEQNKNCTLLYEYLRSILYDAKIRMPDMGLIEEPYRALAQELQTLQQSVEKMQTCYSQRIFHMEEHPESFDTMVSHMQEREQLLFEERERTQYRLAQKAYHDPGTGIYNRLYFEEYMDRILMEEQDFTFAYMDLDGLKYVNDHFGHNEGDRYIRAYISAVCVQFRSTDLFARVGGDEFVVVASNCAREVVEAKLIRAQEVFRKEHSRGYPASFSYGMLVICGSVSSLTLSEIVQQADAEMYKYKQANKARLDREREEQLRMVSGEIPSEE